MEDNKKVIIFAGDSFTWGEGLELYIPTSKWESEREVPNGWLVLSDKQDSETIEFRESNRFGGIVSKHFGVTPKIHPYNGGQFETPINDIERIIKNIDTSTIKSIIIQFTPISRMLLHLDMECKCSFCIKTGFEKPWNIYTRYLESVIHNKELSASDRFGLEYLRDNHNIPFENLDMGTIFKNINDYFKPMYYENMQIYIDKYILKWMNITPVYFLDSWDEYTSTVLSDFDVIQRNLISLKGFDGNYYTNWNKWENTFPYKRIVNEFPKTQNGHPTLIQHRYIAESIIEKLNYKTII